MTLKIFFAFRAINKSQEKFQFTLLTINSNKFSGIWYFRWGFHGYLANNVKVNSFFLFFLIESFFFFRSLSEFKADLKKIFLKCESFYFWNGVIIAKFILSLFFVSWTELYTCTHITSSSSFCLFLSHSSVMPDVQKLNNLSMQNDSIRNRQHQEVVLCLLFFSLIFRMFHSIFLLICYFFASSSSWKKSG